jgi:hypothetical protein
MNDPQLTDLKRRWCDDVRPLVTSICKTYVEFTVDDLHTWQSVPAPAHPNWWGVLVAQMKNTGLITRIGYRPSKRPEANSRVVSVWRHSETVIA